jgi:hypothetical protein
VSREGQFEINSAEAMLFADEFSMLAEMLSPVLRFTVNPSAEPAGAPV